MAAMKSYEAGQQQSRQQSDAYHKELADTTVTIDDLKMKVDCTFGAIYVLSLNIYTVAT